MHVWDIYIQSVQNDAFNSLQTNEWFAFIDALSHNNNFKNIDDVFAQADESEDPFP